MSIASSLEALAQAKEDIAAAIVAQGGTVGDGDGFADFAADIATIATGFKVETQTHELVNDAAFIDYTPSEITDIAGAVLVYLPLSGYGDFHGGVAINARIGSSQWGSYRNTGGGSTATYYGTEYGAVVYPTGLSPVIRFDKSTRISEASPYKAGSYVSIVWGT